jgi:signal transduction histidine kinase
MLNINERKQTEGALRHSQEMLRALISHQERVREEERKRIAREIHDELGQNLFALRLDIEALHERTRHTHPKINERTGEALAHIDATMKAARLAINNLRPSVLDLGLTAAVEWQVRDFRRTSGIVAELEMDDLDDTLDEDRATALFRILQEALAYVARHSQSSRVRVELRRDGDMLLMEVGNQGSGIFPGCRRKANTFGLAGIAARAYALGGEMKVEVSEGKGTRTRLTVSIPLKESASWPAQPGAKVMQAQILYSHAIDTARPAFCSASRA